MAHSNPKAAKWEPKTKTQALMLPQYRGQPDERRMQAALEKVIQGETQAQAARDCGVSRSRLNEHFKAWRSDMVERQERSRIAAIRRAGGLPDGDPASPAVQAAIQGDLTPYPKLLPKIGADGPPILQVSGERRRIPPIGEFVRRYFDGFTCFDCGVHHEIPKFHDEMMTMAKDPAVKRGLFLVPPGHSKSTCITTWCTVHDFYEDPNMMTSFVSAGGDLAEAFVYQVANLLTDPRLYENCTANLIDELGSLKEPGSGWSKEGFYLGRISPEKDPSLRAYGWASKIYGRRQHKIILDDIADVDNQTNPDMIEKMRRKIVREYDTRVGKNGKLLIVGTRIHVDDIYSHLLTLPKYKVFRRPCIVDEVGQQTLWPDHFGYVDAVSARSGMTPAEFELVYQNSDMPSVDSVFNEEHLKKCHDEERHIGHVPRGTTLFVGIDPAGAGEHAGHTAMVCLALDQRTGLRYLVDIVNAKQMRAPQLKDQIFDWATMYRPREIIVEANGLQSQLVQYNQELLHPLTEAGIRVTGHITHGGRGRGGKADHEFGVQAMAPMFYNGQISLPWADIESRRRVSELETQLMRFPYGLKSDVVMALWFAWSATKDFQRSQLIEPFDATGTADWPSWAKQDRRVWDPATGQDRAANWHEQNGYALDSMHSQRLVNVRREVMVPD
jgi:hypothetical protein